MTNTTVADFLKNLYPNKHIDDILIDTRQFDPPKKFIEKPTEKVKELNPTELNPTELNPTELNPEKVKELNPTEKSRKERRFLERQQKKSEKTKKIGKDRELAKEKDRALLDQIRLNTRAEIGKRLEPILFGKRLET